MPYAVYLDLDAAGSCELDRITGRLDKLGIGICTPRRLGHNHHLTLAAYDELDVSGIERALRDLAINSVPLAIDLVGVGCFPGERSVVFASPMVTNDLLLLHERYFDIAAAHGVAMRYYNPGSWFPHVSLAVELTKRDLRNALEALCDDWTPFECKLDAIRLVRYNPAETLLRGSLAKP
jgi:hypothetical protein